MTHLYLTLCNLLSLPATLIHMPKRLKCQVSRNLSHLTLCITLMFPCLVSGKESVSRDPLRIEHAQKVPETVRRTVSRAHRSKAAAKQARPRHKAATNANKSMTASSVTKLGILPTNRSNGQLHGTKAIATWSAETRPISNPPLTRFEKTPEYRFEEDFLSGPARVNLLDRNNDGMIDPMEYALGWIDMTDVGDVGLRERDMAMERMWLQDRSKPGHMVRPVRIDKNKPRAVPQQRSVKRHTQKSL